MDFKYYWEKILSALRVRPLTVGIEVSDLALRLAYFDGKAWHFGGVRLEPGIIEAGKIKNREQLVLALKTLKAKAFNKNDVKKRINAIVSLSSISIYSQVFSLPIIEGENLDKAIQLNIQMVSPVDVAQAYSGWQMVGEDQKALRLEILSAFIDRSMVDDLSRALLDAGFLTVALESRALALTRLLREEDVNFEIERPYVVVSLDNSGLDFLIIRGGQLYFEYFNPWRDIVNEKGQISPQAFEAAITRSLHQVINFYGQHWPEPLEDVVLSATALKEDAERIIKENFSLVARELKPRTVQSIGPEWFVAVGCGLRGLKPRSQDKEMSLLGIGAEESFRREQLLYFANLWRLLIPISLGLLLVSFVLADVFLIQTRRGLESQLLYGLPSEQAKENQTLQTQAYDFNREVALIQSTQKATVYKSKFWDKISGPVAASKLTITRLSFQSPDAPITIAGSASSEDQIIAFKNALEGDPSFQDVNLPFSGIQTAPGGAVSFSMTFRLRQ
jgi:hypothetical protein